MERTVPATLARLAEEGAARLRPTAPALADLLPGCLTNAWVTTVQPPDGGAGFVPTGDIPAMWHRDTVGQLRPYLSLVAQDRVVAGALSAAVGRMAQALVYDPYANAFNAGPDGAGAGHDDHPPPQPLIWERKYELDSPAAFLAFGYQLWRAGGGSAHLDATFDAAVAAILTTWRIEQEHETHSGYRFLRRGGAFAHDSLDRDGRGTPVGWTGMTWSGFRPSDDKCRYGYLVPANAAAAVALRGVLHLVEEGLLDARHRAPAADLEAGLSAGVAEHGTVATPDGPMYAYEVDGLGGALLIDDANTPSLLSLPYLGWCAAEDPVYRRTRAFVLSDANPSYAAGRLAHGMGSPHTPPGWVWPIGVSVQALTSSSQAEKRSLLLMLAATTHTGLMHESFDADDPSRATRPWFAWANSLYAEALLDLAGLTVPGWHAPSPAPRGDRNDAVTVA